MFEVSEKTQTFINTDCDMSSKLASNLIKMLGGEIEFVKNYEAHIRKGITINMPQFNSTLKITKFWEDNKIDSLIWATAHAQECTKNHNNNADRWLSASSFIDKLHHFSVGDISTGLADDKNTVTPTIFIMELAYQLCLQYRDFIIDFE